VQGLEVIYLAVLEVIQGSIRVHIGHIFQVPRHAAVIFTVVEGSKGSIMSTLDMDCWFQDMHELIVCQLEHISSNLNCNRLATAQINSSYCYRRQDEETIHVHEACRLRGCLPARPPTTVTACLVPGAGPTNDRVWCVFRNSALDGTITLFRLFSQYGQREREKKNVAVKVVACH